MTSSIQCICSRISKNERGLKIHQGRMRCLTAATTTQRTEVTSDKTQEEPGLEATHSAQSLLVSSIPAASSSPATITQETASPDNAHGLRDELRLLKRQYKSVGEVESASLADLRAILRKQLLTLQRAEFHRRRRKERARKRAAFLANPFKLTKQLLGQKRAGRLTCSKDAINDHLKATYSDSIREQSLGPCNALITPPEPSSDFDLKEPRLREVEELVRRARSSSAPGPSEVPYKVYKNCPLSVESKIFFSIVAKRLSNFLLSNKYIDTSSTHFWGYSWSVESTLLMLLHF